MKMVVYLKGGASFAVDVERFSSRRGPGGGLSSLEWDTPAGWKTKLHTIDPSEIAALVVVQDDSDGGA